MSAEAPTTSLSNSQEKTRGNSGEKTSSHRVVLYEGLFRDGNKSFQAELEADLVKPDHAERDLVRKNMSELGAVGAQADALVEKMLFNRSMPGKSTIRYTSSSKATKSSNSVKNSATLTNKQTSPKTITADDQDNAAHVSAYYVKKEKLKKIKHAWHPYPANVTDSPIRKVAEAKVAMAIEKSYANLTMQTKKIRHEMKLEMDVRKVIYTRERQNILDDYNRGLSLLKEKYEKKKASTLKLGRMRGGVAIERSKREAQRLKARFIVRHRNMLERRARAVRTIKAEYFDDFKEKRLETGLRNTRAKTKHLNMAWKKHTLINNQENKDAARAFAIERQRAREIAASRMLRKEMNSDGSSASNLGDDLLDNDGSKARKMYKLKVLHNIIRPSLLEELRLALKRWRGYTIFVRRRELIREELNC
eukprot:g4924.t1